MVIAATVNRFGLETSCFTPGLGILKITTESTSPIDGQKPGTSGLRKPTKTFMKVSQCSHLFSVFVWNLMRVFKVVCGAPCGVSRHVITFVGYSCQSSEAELLPTLDQDGVWSVLVTRLQLGFSARTALCSAVPARTYYLNGFGGLSLRLPHYLPVELKCSTSSRFFYSRDGVSIGNASLDA